MKIPPGTQPNTIFRLKNRGIPPLKKFNNSGDQLVRVHIEIPKNITAQQVQYMEDFHKITNNRSVPMSVKFKEDMGKILNNV